jgi:mannose-6-phosphate isomerase-like protein (cupin superfamily)
MIRTAEEMRTDKKIDWLGGKGEVQLVHIMERDEFQNKGRLFALNIIEPGGSIGMHTHKGELEAYYVLKGEGIFDEEGVRKPIKAGELGYITVGQSHAIENTGDTNLEFIALVLFE